MRIYEDWCCRVLPMMGDLLTDPKEALDALITLKNSGIDRFHMMPEYHADIDSVPMFLLKREKSMQELKHILPPEIRIDTAACVCLTERLHQTVGLAKLCIPKTNYLPIRLPMMPEQNWLAPEINKLLYHSNLKLLFMNFDLYPIFYPTKTFEKWLYIPNAAYQFNYKSLAEPKMRFYLKLLLKRNATILFGTSVSSPKKACYYEFAYYKEEACKYFHEFEQEELFFRKKIYRK